MSTEEDFFVQLAGTQFVEYLRTDRLDKLLEILRRALVLEGKPGRCRDWRGVGRDFCVDEQRAASAAPLMEYFGENGKSPLRAAIGGPARLVMSVEALPSSTLFLFASSSC